MKSSTKLLLIALLCLSSFFSNAQKNDTLEIQHNEKGKISFARFKPDPNRKIQDGASFLKGVLHAKPEDEFRLIKETIDKLGISHRIYWMLLQQFKIDLVQLHL